LPAQKINPDICAVPSYDHCPMLLRNHYGVEMGTTGLIIQAESLGEIMADKLLSFTLRPNRIKNRDLWDLAWLNQQGVTLAPARHLFVNLQNLKVSDPFFPQDYTAFSCCS